MSELRCGLQKIGPADADNRHTANVRHRTMNHSSTLFTLICSSCFSACPLACCSCASRARRSAAPASDAAVSRLHSAHAQLGHLIPTLGADIVQARRLPTDAAVGRTASPQTTRHCGEQALKVLKWWKNEAVPASSSATRATALGGPETSADALRAASISCSTDASAALVAAVRARSCRSTSDAKPCTSCFRSTASCA